MSSPFLSPPEPGLSTPVPPQRAPRGRRVPLAVLLTTSALLGSGMSVGALAVAGAFDGGGTPTTVIERAAATTTPTAATTTTAGAGGGLDAGALYAGTSAGVVDITVTGTASDQQASPFGGAPQSQQTSASGTGFVVDDQGHIVTAAHVVDGASTITVKLQDGTTRRAKLL